jgi:Type VI secretion system/phage-baseplate injector OB domain
MTTFYGKYRGQVQNNIDPKVLGRLQVSVAAVLGDGRLSWAMPCVPYAGSQVGFFAIPPIGANVWVEFEAGDPGQPIWSGCFWGDGESPAAIPEIKVLKTDGITLTLSDVPGAGGFTLEVNPPMVEVPLKLVCDSSGIELNCTPGSVKLTPTSIELSLGAAKVSLTPASVSINDGALEVI